MKYLEVVLILAAVGFLTLSAFAERGTQRQGAIIESGLLCFAAGAAVHAIRK